MNELIEVEVSRLKELKSKGWWRFVTCDHDDDDMKIISKAINFTIENLD
tara:strand:- start:16832 stop:16978 length:147 start_codon:yes stop_codon:yes gene_type:complete